MYQGGKGGGGGGRRKNTTEKIEVLCCVKVFGTRALEWDVEATG